MKAADNFFKKPKDNPDKLMSEENKFDYEDTKGGMCSKCGQWKGGDYGMNGDGVQSYHTCPIKSLTNKIMFTDILFPLLSNGCYVVVEDNEKDYMVFSPHKDTEENYRRSGWWDSIKKAKQYIGCFDGYVKNEIDEGAEKGNWKIVEIYKPQYKPLEVGQRVGILDSIKETSDWDIYKNDFPEMIWNNY